MRPGVRADGVALGGDMLENFGIVGGVFADREEDRLGAFVGKGLEDRRRVDRPWAVIKRQHHFLVAQEIELLEMLETEAGTAGGVDLHHARDADGVRVGAVGFCGCRSRCRSWSGRGRSRCGGGSRRWGGALRDEGLRPDAGESADRDGASGEKSCLDTHGSTPERKIPRVRSAGRRRSPRRSA